MQVGDICSFEQDIKKNSFASILIVQKHEKFYMIKPRGQDVAQVPLSSISIITSKTNTALLSDGLNNHTQRYLIYCNNNEYKINDFELKILE